jgi:hypothetical protein
MPSTDRAPPIAIDVADYFPLARGDRWRYLAEPGAEVENVGITAREGAVAVLFGTGHALAERYRADSASASLVTPGGAIVVPLLKAPLERGTHWTYDLDEHGSAIPCEGEITEAGATRSIGAATISDCVATERACRYPAGAPFAQATVHRVIETYCRGVGRIERVQTFEPAPPAPLAPSRTERLEGFRLSSATLPRGDRFDCGDFIVLPSDVRAACGASVQAVVPFAGAGRGGGCRYAFENAGAEIAIEARLEPFDPGAALALHVGDVYVDVRATEAACPVASLRRLEPVLRSLVASNAR